MAYTKPTAAEIKARFPEFTSVSDVLIGLVIDECEPQCGEDWLDRDRKPALMFLVAHKLAIQGQPAQSLTPGGTGVSLGVIKRRKVGDVETEYQNANERLGTGAGVNTVSASGYELTPYGREFRTYLRKNFTAVAAV